MFKQQFNESIEKFKECIKQKIYISQCHEYIAKAYYSLKDMLKAEENFKLSIKSDPLNLSSLYAYGIIEITFAKYKEASTPFTNKQSNEQTHTASQKPKQKTPHLNLSAAGTPLTALPQSPPAPLALSTPFSSPFPSVQALPTSPSQLPWPIPTGTPLGSFPDILPLPCAKGSSSSTLFPPHTNQPTKNQKPPPPTTTTAAATKTYLEPIP